ncbi:MAG: OmpA/MotB family protein [Myxococcota bacterium]
MIEDFGDDEGGGEEGAPAWMATFGDMMSLLLTFFVLLLSFANTDIVKFQEMLGSVQDAFGVQEEHPGRFEGLTTSPVELSKRESTSSLDLLDLPTRSTGRGAADAQMKVDIDKLLSERGMDGTIDAELTDRGVVLRVRGGLLFDTGSDQLLPGSEAVLSRIAEVARSFPYRLLIEGHTDDIPVSTDRHPSNWHLSAGRAIAALRYLVEVAQLDPKRMSCAGYADMSPLVPNDSNEHRAINRRIEFVFQSDDAAPPGLSF